ncbi:MAG: sterol desaturase family protein [Planctomycetes bacterium]|nr:sterol desaturase family protein [Planctomycetota bacterium]
MLFAIATGTGLALATADLAEQHLRGGRRDPHWLGTAFFLGLVLAVYAAIQFAGFAVVPSLAHLDEAARRAVGLLLGRSSDCRPLTPLATAGVTVGTFYLLGLWDYLIHRHLLHGRLLWFTHEYHHLPNHVAVYMPGIAARPFTVVANVPRTVLTLVTTYALAGLAGLDAWDTGPLKLVLFAQALIGTANHSSALRRLPAVQRWFRWAALASPQEHLLHHAVGIEGNYGNFTTLWDRLFGTYLDPEDPAHARPRTGLAYDQDFLGVLTLGRLKLPRSVRERLDLGRFCNLAGGHTAMD